MSEEAAEVGRCWPKGTTLQLCKMNKSKVLMYSIMTITNNARNL